MTHMLDIRQVRFDYDDLHMNFSLSIMPGEWVAVIGPSGAGKSTLLSLLAGFDSPLSGDILIDGENVSDLTPGARPVTLLFQDSNLFAHLTLEKNIALGIRPSARLSAVEKESVMAAMQKVGIAGLGNRLPGAVSGGERQRAALARALVMQRKLLLLDEPFAALGPALRQEMIALVKRLATEQNLTVLLVTHQPEDAMRLGGRVIFVAEGQVAWQGTANDLQAKRYPPQVADYLGAHVGA